MEIQISDQTAKRLKDLAEREHLSSADMIERLIDQHCQPQTLPRKKMTDFAGALKHSPSFQGDPVEQQKAMRDEWR